MKRVSEERLVEIDALIRALGCHYDFASRTFVANTGKREWRRAEFVGVVPGISREELTAFMAWKVDHQQREPSTPFPVDIEFVNWTEARLAVKLPFGYVAKMCKSNGGQVRAGDDWWDLFPILDDSDKKRLKRSCNDICWETQSAKTWTGFPPAGVAIASNGGGDLLVLVPDPDDPGRLADAVWMWDHETGEMIQVANDFADLRQGE